MATKKYLLLTAALIVLFQTISLAQTTTTDWGWNWKDSSKVATKDIPQYNEFLNNQFPYPAKPRDQWELGLGIGLPFLASDLKQDGIGFGGTVTLRKALNHTFSLRPYYAFYAVKGLKKIGASNPPLVPPSYDFKHTSHHLGLNVLTSLNTASYYRGNPKVNLYLITGFELWSAQVKQSIGGTYNVVYDPFTNSNLIADNHSRAMSFGFNVGLGAAVKLSNKINLAFEAINTLTNYDYLEGYSSPYSNSYDAWWYGGLKLNINLGNTAKRVQPLWWINPNNFAYSELNSPKHMKMPKVVLPDADGDGVTDQFDLEPNTPAGAPVDSHGVSRDTDGDGVPDYRDKELLTPQKCFPVDKDGIGTCPEPACCKELRDQIANMQLAPKVAECAVSDLPSIQFKTGTKLSKDAQKLLDAAASKIKANPNCKVKVIGHPAASKAAQQLSFERISAVIKYLVEKQGIAETRFLPNLDGGTGDASTIDLQGTTEDGPNTIQAPHPNLKSKG